MFHCATIHIQIARYMLDHGHHVITGSSVHNQRIERLWRDAFRCVLSLFYQLFYYLEDVNILDPVSEVDLYCLHYVYVSKINSALKMFADGWNGHALTTEHSMTPFHLFTAGTLMSGQGLATPSDMTNSNEDIHLELAVSVPSTNCPLSDDGVRILNSFVETTSSSENYGIELYRRVRDFVQLQT